MLVVGFVEESVVYERFASGIVYAGRIVEIDGIAVDFSSTRVVVCIGWAVYR